MMVDISYSISSELRERAERGDAQAWNFLGEYTLKVARPHLDRLPYGEWSTTMLRGQIQGLDYRVSDEYETLMRYGTGEFVQAWCDGNSSGRELSLVRLAVEAREAPEEDHLGNWNRARDCELQQAFRCFQQAAKLGDPEGYWNLGWRYYLGEGVEPSDACAICCWQAASKRGHAESTEHLKKLLPGDLHFALS
jgi:hypothetical protein